MWVLPRDDGASPVLDVPWSVPKDLQESHMTTHRYEAPVPPVAVPSVAVPPAGARPIDPTSSMRCFCVLAMVAGLLLFAAGAYTGYAEGVRADETHTGGQVMPAEVAAAVLGPVLAFTGLMMLLKLRRPRR